MMSATTKAAGAVAVCFSLCSCAMTTPRVGFEAATREQARDQDGAVIVYEGRSLSMPTEWFEEDSRVVVRATMQPVTDISSPDGGNAVEVLSEIEIEYVRLTGADPAAKVALARSRESEARSEAIAAAGLGVAIEALGGQSVGALEALGALLERAQAGNETSQEADDEPVGP